MVSSNEPGIRRHVTARPENEDIARNHRRTLAAITGAALVIGAAILAKTSVPPTLAGFFGGAGVLLLLRGWR